MYPQLLVSTVLINFVIADQNLLRHGDDNQKTAVANKNNLITHNNLTYIEKAENMIRLPQMNEKKERKKFMKKAPKRTIQKIIKKNKQKTKKIYIIKMTSPTVSPEKYDIGQDELSQWKDDSTTTQPNQRKRPRKYNTKIARYPMPFQRLAKMKVHKRDKRDINQYE